jgi:hypothetical protein
MVVHDDFEEKPAGKIRQLTSYLMEVGSDQ